MGYITENNTPLNAQLARHRAFSGYNCGCCRKMLGKIAIASIFVSDASKRWDDHDINEYIQFLNRSEQLLLDLGGREAGLSVALKEYYRCILTHRTDRAQYQNTVNEVLCRLGYHSVCELCDELKKNNKNISSVAVLFVFDTNDTSFAVSMRGRNNANSTRRACPDSDEYAFIYFKGQSMECTIAHEILHLFGAIDFYYPEAVKKQAGVLFPNSIMFYYTETPCIDDLTRYLIGWESKLSPTALLFLQNTLCTRRDLGNLRIAGFG